MIQHSDRNDYIKVPTKPEFKKRVKRIADKLDLPMGAILRIAFDNYELMVIRREEQNIPILSDEMSAALNQSYDDIDNGRYLTIKPEDEIDNVLNGL